MRVPLTGLPLADGEAAPDRPAMVVKIDNDPEARPQTGLNQADIVFEETSRAATRFAAVFHCAGLQPRRARSAPAAPRTSTSRPG